MPCPYKLMLSSVLCYLYSIHFLPLRQGEYHEVGRGYVYLSLSVFHFPFSVFRLYHTPSPCGYSPCLRGRK